MNAFDIKGPEKNPPRYMRDFSKAAQTYFESGNSGSKQYMRMEHYLMNRLGEGGRLLRAVVGAVDLDHAQRTARIFELAAL